MHLVYAVATLFLQPLLRADIADVHPEASAATLEQLLRHAITLTLSVQIPLFFLTGILAWKLPTGHPFAVRPATVSQLFGVAFTTISTPPFHLLQTVAPVFIALQATVIVLIWVPGTARRFTSERARFRRSRFQERGQRSADGQNIT